MTVKQCKFSMPYCYYYAFLSKQLKVKHVISKAERSMNVLKQCAKIIQSLKDNIRSLFSLLCFHSKV